MPEEPVSAGSFGPASRVRDKTFVLVCWSDADSEQDELVRLLVQLGGEVRQAVTPDLDYLVVLDRRPGRATKEERRAGALNEDGAAIQVLDRAGLYDLLTPTRQEALALLRGGDEGLAVWRLRRRDDKSRVPIDLFGAKLPGAKLTNIVLYRVNLDSADLSGADLSGSCLGELVRVNLDGALLPGAYVPHLTDCSARNADFTNVRFNPAVLVRTDFTGAKLLRVEGSWTRSEEADFRDADLTGALLQNSTFARCDFAGANLTDAYLNDCDLTGAVFRGANLTRASLSRAKLADADQADANLTGANLSGADLTGTTVGGACFEGANLYAALVGRLGPGRPVGLVVPPPVPRERIGPAMRSLEALRDRARTLRMSLSIDPDRQGTDFTCLTIDDSGRSVRAFSESSGHVHREASGRPSPLHACQAGALCEAMLELAQLWPDAELYLETLRVTAGSVKATPKDAHELALAAWHEAFARPLPSPAERKTLQKAERERLLGLLRGGPEGIRQWNALRSEALTRAGHIRRAELAHHDLRGANFGHHTGAYLGGLDFQAANFAGANLTGCRLTDCSLQQASFRGAVLDGVCFGGNLRQADFECASLERCSLRGARLRGARFTNANLRKADLAHADLRGADLSSAVLDGARLEEARHDATTRVPEGFVFPRKPGKDDPPQPRPSGLDAGSKVQVRFGTFVGMTGEVKGVLEAAGTLTVELTIFGRPVAVDLAYDEVEQL
jgi:uncharacterized protein YjbI with pentapeptide repeats